MNFILLFLYVIDLDKVKWYYQDMISNFTFMYFTKDEVISLVKKIILLYVFSLVLFLGIQSSVQGWFEIVPFYDVKVVKAMTFSIEISEELEESSLFFDKASISDTIRVYVAYLSFVYKGTINGYGAILILTDSSNHKLFTFVSESPTKSNQFPSTLVFGVHLILDPLRGITLPSGKGSESVVVRHLSSTGLELVDLNGTSYVMIPGSDVVLSDLDVLIPARERTTSWY